jgi:D-lactate dehydrogenase
VRIAVFSSRNYDERFFEAVESDHELTFQDARLNSTTLALARGYPCVCVFVNDVVDRSVLTDLAQHGLQVVALRCAGFNNVDLVAAAELGISVVRVPAYSPHSVAEHTFALILGLNRRIPRASDRVRDGNFRLEGLLGFDLHGRTIGVVGTGTIGECICQIARGFGCRVLATDVRQNAACVALGVEYVEMQELFCESDIITLHCPLMPETHHLINDDAICQMKQGVMLVNTSRGGIIDTQAAIRGLKSGHVGSMAIDVYEEEADLFFEDLSDKVIGDDVFSRLLTFPNVLITGHQAFFTSDALEQIAVTTLANVSTIESGEPCENSVTSSMCVS